MRLVENTDESVRFAVWMQMGGNANGMQARETVKCDGEKSVIANREPNM